MNTTELSVIVLTNNRPERCADSIRRNAEALSGLKAEMLVVNNGQQPVSLPEEIAQIKCRVLQMPRNLGAVARNEGLKASKSPFILVLDDDAYIDPGLGHSMIEVFKEDPKVGAVAFRIQNGLTEESCLLPTVFHGCACGFRRSAIEKAGGYPNGYLYYGEEYHLAFRLYQEGCRIALCNHGRMVRHVRDRAGRNTGRILRLLIRNNIFLWAAFFPWTSVLPAIQDTLQRYAAVARKENARQGFKAGLALVPQAILRGLLHRRPLRRELFEYITLLAPLERTCVELKQRGIRETILCGVGKFPSLWVRALRRQGIAVRELWDFNTCWEKASIAGVPVRVVSRENIPLHPSATLLLGTTSLSDNLRWQQGLAGQSGININGDKALLATELSSSRGIFDLHRTAPLRLIFPENKGRDEEYAPMAPPLLTCMAAERSTASA